MPDRDVRTIGDLIWYQYAKLIARSAFGAANGKEAKGKRRDWNNNSTALSLCKAAYPKHAREAPGERTP
jgi:hypothetical protein